MCGFIVMRELQRQAIGLPANALGIRIRKIARRIGKTIRPGESRGPSAPNATSNSSSAPANARVVCARERLKSSEGVSLADMPHK